jgi:CUB domain
MTYLVVLYNSCAFTRFCTVCGGELTNPRGTITSPQPSSGAKDCVWLISAPEGAQIAVRSLDCMVLSRNFLDDDDIEHDMIVFDLRGPVLLNLLNFATWNVD